MAKFLDAETTLQYRNRMTIVQNIVSYTSVHAASSYGEKAWQRGFGCSCVMLRRWCCNQEDTARVYHVVNTRK